MSEHEEAPQPERVVRLLFRYGRDGVPELVSRQTTEMVLPATEAEEMGASAADMGAAGTVFELRDADQRPLVARSLDDRIPTTHEVFAPDAPIQRVKPRRRSGAFEVIVRDVPGAEFGALVTPPSPNMGAADASEVTFRLSDIPEESDADGEP